eukprot:4439212-Alexandrium_andersonii.AAC.1
MSASLVGSEMCIRDRVTAAGTPTPEARAHLGRTRPRQISRSWALGPFPCLLYTSDAADDM